MFENDEAFDFDNVFLGETNSPPTLLKSPVNTQKRSSIHFNDEHVNKKVCINANEETFKVPASRLSSIVNALPRSNFTTNVVDQNAILEPNNQLENFNRVTGCRRVGSNSNSNFGDLKCDRSVLANTKNVVLNGEDASPLKKKIVKRKFPGPAGLLPEIEDFNVDVKKLEEQATSNNIINVDMVCSQTSENYFRTAPWMQMCNDFQPFPGSIFLPDKYNISWIKSRAEAKKLINQKAPFLAAAIQSIEVLNGKIPTATVTLKDPTGEIQGTILHDLYEEFASDLTINSVIVLKQTGVLTTSFGTKHYINITGNNLITIYSSQNHVVQKKNVDNNNEIVGGHNVENSNESPASQQHEEKLKIISVQAFKSADFLNNIDEIKKRHKLEVEKGNLTFTIGPKTKYLSFRKVSSNPSLPNHSKPNNAASRFTNANVSNLNNKTTDTTTISSTPAEVRKFNFKVLKNNSSLSLNENVNLNQGFHSKSAHQQYVQSTSREQNIFEEDHNYDFDIDFEEVERNALEISEGKNSKTDISKSTSDNLDDVVDNSFLLSVSQRIEDEHSSCVTEKSQFSIASRSNTSKKHLEENLINLNKGKNGFDLDFDTPKGNCNDNSRSIFEPYNKQIKDNQNVNKINSALEQLQAFKFKARVGGQGDTETEKRIQAVERQDSLNSNCESNANDIASSVLRGSQITIASCSTNDKELLQDVFSGIDADSLFEDF